MARRTLSASPSCDDDPLLASPEPAALLQKSSIGRPYKHSITSQVFARVDVESGSPPTTPVRRKGGRDADFSERNAVVNQTPEIPIVSMSDWHDASNLPACRLGQLSAQIDRRSVPVWPYESDRENISGLSSFEQEEEISRFLGSLNQRASKMPYLSSPGDDRSSKFPLLSHLSDEYSADPGGREDYEQTTGVAERSIDLSRDAHDRSSGKNDAIVVEKPLSSESREYNANSHNTSFYNWCLQLPPSMNTSESARADLLQGNMVHSSKQKNHIESQGSAYQEGCASASESFTSRSRDDIARQDISGVAQQKSIEINAGTSDRSFAKQVVDVVERPLTSGQGKYNMISNDDDSRNLSDDMDLQACKRCGRRFRSDRLLVHEIACEKAHAQSRRGVFVSQTQRCKEISRGWWSEETAVSTSAGSSSVSSAYARVRSASATLSGRRSRQQNPFSSVRSGREQGAKPVPKAVAGSKKVSELRAGSIIDCVQNDKRARNSFKENAVEKKRTSYDNNGRLEGKNRTRVNVEMATKPTNACGTPTKKQRPSGIQRSSSQPSRVLRQHASSKNRKTKDGMLGNAYANCSSHDRRVSDEPTAYNVEAENIWMRTSEVDIGRDEPKASWLSSPRASLEYFTPPPKSSASHDFTPSPISAHCNTLNYSITRKDVMLKLSQLSDTKILPDLEKLGPASAPANTCTLNSMLRFSSDRSDDDFNCNDREPHLGALPIGDQQSRNFPSATRIEACLDTQSQDACKREADFLLPDPPTLPSLEVDFHLSRADIISPSDSVQEVLTVEELATNYDDCYFDDRIPRNATNRTESRDQTYEDDNLRHLSDPDTLEAMMCDVKLLGAHVDCLITAQQRLFSQEDASEPSPEIIDNSVRKQANSPSRSVKISVSAEDKDASWPSEPYDPSRYSDTKRSCDFEENERSSSIWSCTRWDDVELNSMVDSLERQSALFRARIRKCSERVSERRQDFESTRSKLV